MDYSSREVFPEFLEIGDSGPAVTVLTAMLHFLGYGAHLAYASTADYNENVANSVRKLQHDLNIEEDGKFGLQTQAELIRKYPINFRTLCFRGPALTKIHGK